MSEEYSDWEEEQFQEWKRMQRQVGKANFLGITDEDVI